MSLPSPFFSEWSGPDPGALLHLWPLEAQYTIAGIATDVVPHGQLHGTIGAGVLSVDGPGVGLVGYDDSTQYDLKARAISDDASGYIDLASTPIPDLTADWSIGFWVELSDITKKSFDNGSPRYFSFFDGVAGISAGNPSDGFLTVEANGVPGVGSGSIAATKLKNNKWAHYTIVHHAGSSTLEFYVNAAFVASAAAEILL